MGKTSITDAIPSCDDLSLMSGLLAQKEMQESGNEISDILTTHENIFLQNKALSKSEKAYRSPLAISNFQYYLSLNKKRCLDSLLSALLLIFFFIGLSLGFRQLNMIYKNFYHMDVSEQTLQAAIDYTDRGNYDAAILRLNLLLESGWDGYTVYHELSLAYYLNGNYNKAFSILCDFIVNHYGIANCTYFTDAFHSLLEDSGSTSGVTAEKIHKLVSQCQPYADLYRQIEQELYWGQNQAALYDCEMLKTAGADCFHFACLYVTALVENDCIDTAYHFVITLAQSDQTYQEKSITLAQRKLLLNYIRPHLDPERQFVCDYFLGDGMDELNLHSGLQYSSLNTSVSPDDISDILQEKLKNEFMYLNPLDTIAVSDSPALLYGREGYPATVTHIDGSSTYVNHFFYDTIYGYIYMYFDGNYVNLLENEPFDKPLTDYHELTASDILGTYQNSQYDSFIIEVTDYSQTDTYPFYQISFSVIDTTTNDVLINIENASCRAPYVCVATDDIAFTLIWGSDVVLLIHSDYDQKCHDLMGRYVKI